METRKQHWEKVYITKTPEERSWTQKFPQTSLTFIHSFNIPKTARIIDVGGGDSMLVDKLLDEGFENITVLDISETACLRAQQRLGERAAKVSWIVSDIMSYYPTMTFDVWHDRATFHFLMTHEEIAQYLAIARKAVEKFMIVGTFSDHGPDHCSGLNVHRYNEDQLQVELINGFDKIKCITEDHLTPFNTLQNFLFCSFKRQDKNNSH